MSRPIKGTLRRDKAVAELTVDKSSTRVALTKGPEWRKLKNLQCDKSVTGKRLMETTLD
jgi:hypothetical protein